MIKTNGERLNEVLDKILEVSKNSNSLFIARRMREDEQFAIGALALFTSICYLQPSLLEQISKRVLAMHLNNFFNED